MNETYAIEIKNLNKSFKDKSGKHEKVVFSDFSFAVKHGEIVAVTGESGGGKSTLLNMIGLIEPSPEGTVFIDGQAVPTCTSRKAQKLICNKISYLFQNFALIENFTVEKNLLLALEYVKERRKEKIKQIERSLEQVGLAGFSQRKIYELSGGEQQRVAIARAMLKPSSIVLADEPTGSLDEKNRNEIFSLLREMRQRGKTILIVTHDQQLAEMCDRQVRIPKLH